MVACNIEKPFSVEEVKETVMSMGKDKSQGPDGFSMFFYQKCWDIIHVDLIEVFAEFFDNGVIRKDVNATFLVLLPKKNAAMEMMDFRPISLVGSIYKIIAKVLASRLKEAIELVVLKTQSVFVKGRKILDSTL